MPRLATVLVTSYFQGKSAGFCAALESFKLFLIPVYALKICHM